MATYLPNVTDIIPEFRPFTPNFDFYNQVLQVKNAQYQQGYKKISNLYGSALNSPLSRDSNIERRDKYFKDIEQEIKKISGLDLSLPQNVAAAGDVFKPFYEDKDIQVDWMVTKSASDAMNAHEILNNCVGEDCGQAKAWDVGKRAVDYRLQEFKDASTEEARNFGKIKYTPYTKYADDVLKFMKDNKVEITREERSGRYNITTTNGPLLEGPLYNMIKTLYQDDPNITDMYKTKAYVERNDYVYSRAQALGSKEEAEKEYMLDKTSTISNSLDTQIKDVNTQLEIFNDKQNKLLRKAKLTPEEDQQLNSLEQYIGILEKSRTSLESAKDNFTNLDQVDIKTLRARVDGVMANGLFENDLKQMASNFSKIGYKQTFEEDKYEYAKFQNALNFSSQLQLKKIGAAMDWEMFKNKKLFEVELELEKERQLAGKGEEANLSIGETKEGDVQKVDTYNQVSNTVTTAQNQYKSAVTSELKKIYQALKTEDSAESKQLINQIFGTTDDKIVSAAINLSPSYQQQIYNRAVKNLQADNERKGLISPGATAVINKNKLYLDAVANQNIANSIKVGRAMQELDIVDEDDKQYVKYFVDNKTGIVDRNKFITSMSKFDYDAEDAGELYDDFLEIYKEQYSNPEASAAYKTTPFIGGPFTDKTGGQGIRPATVDADPLKYLSDNYDLVNSVMENVRASGQFLNADGEVNTEDQALFNELFRDFNTRLDRKKDNKERANVSMTYEALSDRPGFAKVTLTPSRDWLEKNLAGKNKEDDAAKMSQYENGIVSYIPDEKVHNSFDSKIKSLGEAVFETNGNAITIGDKDDPQKGGYFNITKDGDNYITTSKTVSWDAGTNQFVFNAPNTSSGFSLDPDELLDNAFTDIQNSQDVINRMNLILEEANRTIVNNRRK